MKCGESKMNETHKRHRNALKKQTVEEVKGANCEPLCRINRLRGKRYDY